MIVVRRFNVLLHDPSDYSVLPHSLLKLCYSRDFVLEMLAHQLAEHGFAFTLAFS